MIWVYVATTIFGGAFLIPMVLGGLSSDLEGGFDGDLAETDMSGGFDVDVDLDIDADIDLDIGTSFGDELIASSTAFDGNIVGDGGLGDIAVDGGAIEGHPIDGRALGSRALEASSIDSDGPDGSIDNDDLLGSIFSSLISFRTIVFFCAFFGTAGLVFGAFGYGTPITAASAVLIGSIAAVANSVLFGLIKNSQANSQISDRTFEGRPAMVVLPMEGSQRGRVRIELSGQPQYIVARPLEGSVETEQKFDVGDSVVVVKIEEGTAHVAALPELDLKEES